MTVDTTPGTRPTELVTDDHVRAEPMIQFFRFAHLPPVLAATSRLFAVLAIALVDGVPRNPERTVALRKLLEAKDCAVRAILYKVPA